MFQPARRLAACAVSASLLLLACYDHSYTQALLEERRRAKAAEGARVRGDAPSAGVVKSGKRHGRVRFHVAKAFMGQHREWKHNLTSLIDAANAIVGPNFNVQFELTSTTEWSPRCDPNRLQDCTAELARADPGEEGDWVVGVLGAAPNFTATFEHLGMAHSPGRHFVLRDVADLAERQAIDRAFDTFTPARRDEIYKKRKSHKRLAVFLHEWGHTLGAMHVQNSMSLLNPAYDDEMQAYDDANHGLIDAALRDLFRYAGTHDELKAYLRGGAGGAFPSEERDALLAQLERAAPETQASAGGEQPRLPEHHFLVKGSEEQLLSGLDANDRDSYRRAAELTAEGDSPAALSLVEPLSARHADNYALQYLACNLAMQLGQQALAQRACPRATSPTAAAK